MGDSVVEQPGGASPRRGRRVTADAPVLTPPTGLSAVPGLGTSIPAQRTAGDLRPTVQPPAPSAVVEPCTCGHARAAHDHYRRGSDCGACGAADCAEFRPEGGPIRRALRRFGGTG